MDPELKDIANHNDVIDLGADLYFHLSMEDPIPELVYSIKGMLTTFDCVNKF